MSLGTFGDELAAHAAALEDVTILPLGKTREVLAGGALVAVVEPGALEVRLRSSIAAAALRTPDVEPSPRGRGWVRFTPPEVDDFARDRAIAWLESAVRRVLEGEPPG